MEAMIRRCLWWDCVVEVVSQDTQGKPSHGKVENGESHIRQHDMLIPIILNGDCLNENAASSGYARRR